MLNNRSTFLTQKEKSCISKRSCIFVFIIQNIQNRKNKIYILFQKRERLIVTQARKTKPNYFMDENFNTTIEHKYKLSLIQTKALRDRVQNSYCLPVIAG